MTASPSDEPMASETTNLLGRPSAHSTESPVPRTYSNGTLQLTSSCDDLRESVETQLQDLTDASKLKSNELNKPKKNILTSRHAILILVLGCTLSVLLVSIFTYGTSSRPSNSSSAASLQPETFDGPVPFSTRDPVNDLGLFAYQRPEESAPPKDLFMSGQSDEPNTARPTNAWYQNLLLLKGEPSNVHRVYSMPYLLDMIGLVPGVRVHSNRILASSEVLQLANNEQFGLTLGAAPDMTQTHYSKGDLSHKYNVMETTELGVTLQWNEMPMESTIVKGLPYVTMEYPEWASLPKSKSEFLPTIASLIGLGEHTSIDGGFKMKCSADGEKTIVQSELRLHFFESDFTWIVFFSEPVMLQCYRSNVSAETMIQVVESTRDDDSVFNGQPLIIRAAVLNACTTGRNVVTCKEGMGLRQPEESHVEEYAATLRRSAKYYPGKQTSVSYEISEDGSEAALFFDWDMKTMIGTSGGEPHQSLRRLDDEPSLIMFALPHHLDKMDSSMRPGGFRYCKSSLTGRACLVQGATWTINESLPRIGFQAARPPQPQFLPALADALLDDINYTLPEFFQRGAGDTYFSGKMISKLSRILLIAEELDEICSGTRDGVETANYEVVCNNVTLPSIVKRTAALDSLRSSVEIWINGTAETPFVYDVAWGGVVSCGCWFNGETCENKFPNCPAFVDQGLNFGNGFYNDQHFHYGYHIHGAAVVAHFDPEWGKKHFEEVLLLVRNIANPSKADKSFPLFRHKDWYQGSSWASGVPLPPYLNGKNQESASEAIAAYESVALYGQIMAEIWENDSDAHRTAISNQIEQVGKLMTATELRSAQKYWQIKRNGTDKDIYPTEYTGNVIGIHWSTMAQFGTWFGTAPYLPYGIQLLPLTPISEERDEMGWVNEMYYPFSKHCSEYFQCKESGWAVLQVAILATVGYAEEAASRVKELPDEGYVNAGGNGHSKSNTLWYIATRPIVNNPLPMDHSDVRGSQEMRPAPVFQLTDCYAPSTCTDEVLDRGAGKYTCRQRINWLIDTKDNSQWEACSMVGGVEFVDVCGPCAPGKEHKTDGATSRNAPVDTDEHKISSTGLECPPCSEDECQSDLNRCPLFDRSFVCTDGAGAGGCNGSPWDSDEAQCSACCEMTDCQKLRDEESKKITKDGNGLERPKCPPCEPSICYGKVNQCPIHTAPYLCLDGNSLGGCSSRPWQDDGQCSECCEVTITC